MAKRKRRNFKSRRTMNEFDEILGLKLKKGPKINKDDILDMVIDLELYNKAASKSAVSKKTSKKPKGDKGKKRCVKKSRPKRKAYVGKKAQTKHECSHAYENTKKSLDFPTTDSQSSLFAERR